MKLNLEIEKLEQRIAPGGISTGCCNGGSSGSKNDCGDSSKGSNDDCGDSSKDDCGQKEHGNNGFGNGGGDGVPGNSGKEDCNR